MLAQEVWRCFKQILIASSFKEQSGKFWVDSMTAIFWRLLAQKESTYYQLGRLLGSNENFFFKLVHLSYIFCSYDMLQVYTNWDAFL